MNAKVTLVYVHSFVDRHGKLRHYFRRHGRRIALPGEPGSQEFMTAYQAALAGMKVAPAPVAAGRTKSGTVDAAVVGFYKSPAFQALAPNTRRSYRASLEPFRAKNGSKRIHLMERRHVAQALAEKAGHPTAANQLLRHIHALMVYAVAEEMRTDDPTEGIKPVTIRSDGFKPWAAEQVALYRARHALGTTARLALELLINTGAARVDAIKLGRQHVRNGVLSFRRQKTGTPVDIPVLPELAVAIDAMGEARHLTFLVNESGKAIPDGTFGGWFASCCAEAGVPPGYSAHGLRKFAATALADHGATAHELMAWFGWKTLKEAEHYTRQADRKRLALGVVAKLTKSDAG